MDSLESIPGLLKRLQIWALLRVRLPASNWEYGQTLWIWTKKWRRLDRYVSVSVCLRFVQGKESFLYIFCSHFMIHCNKELRGVHGELPPVALQPTQRDDQQIAASLNSWHPAYSARWGVVKKSPSSTRFCMWYMDTPWTFIHALDDPCENLSYKFSCC